MNIEHDPTSFERTHIARFRGEADVRRFIETEWLLSDGVGGFAMGTALGLNTRRYHGWLVHAARPPVGRLMLLSTVMERFTLAAPGVPEETVELSNFEFEPAHLAPRGYRYLKRFERGVSACRWIYRCGAFTVERQMTMGWRGGGVEVRYRVEGPSGAAARVTLLPLVRLHDFHHLIRCDGRRLLVRGTASGIAIGAEKGIELHLATSGGQFHARGDWWFNFHYEQERQRGQDWVEDLFTPGEFRCECTIGTEGSCALVLRASAEPLAPGEVEHGADLARGVEARREHLAAMARRSAPGAPALGRRLDLMAAADAFVVPRRVGDESLMTILAGYPWFGDWGRDTMIALRGLLLVTARFDEALRTLRTFASHRQRGLIPNLFDDYGGAAHYNTVDASLWFIHAACEYRQMSGDAAGFDRDLRGACLDIIEQYRRGTDFGIRMDERDGLIAAGDASTQLTWMDAKRDGVVFTPRGGKAVEVNALWHHALCALAEVLGDAEAPQAAALEALAQRVREHFEGAFWCEQTRCLADVLTPQGEGWVQDATIRPNQVIACSLRFSPLGVGRRREVLAAVEEHLLTPVGLRTLSPRDPRYRGRFEGGMFERDQAYHQGTVWPWLMGPFVEALLRAEEFSEEARRRGRALIEPLLEQMIVGRSLGQIAEVYDGDTSPDRPRLPGGCVAQAWSVAAVFDALAMCGGG